MFNQYSKVISIIFATAFLSACQAGLNDTVNLQNNHQISFNQQNLKLFGTQQDSSGYTKVYVPSQQSGTTPTTIQANFARGDQTPLPVAMQNALALHAYTTCQIKKSQVLSQTNNYINYAATLDKCANGVKFVEYVKAYRMPEGQYSIIASTDANQVNTAQINQLRDIVEKAELSPVS